MANLLWLQGGACSGNTMSFLNAEEPSVCDLVTDFGIRVLWHPSLGLALGEALQKMLRALVAGEIPLDIFVFEGTVINAPDGSGEWNRFAGRPMKQWVADLANVANSRSRLATAPLGAAFPRQRQIQRKAKACSFSSANTAAFLERISGLNQVCR